MCQQAWADLCEAWCDYSHTSPHHIFSKINNNNFINYFKLFYIHISTNINVNIRLKITIDDYKSLGIY
jgi:hypothetical protein